MKAAVTDFELAARDEFAGDATAEQKKVELDSLGTRLIGEFAQAKLDRKSTEERWLKDIRQYRGQYDPEEEAAMGARSKAFVRKTRVKVKTVDSRVADLLFPAGSDKNWEISSTPLPSVSRETLAGIEQALIEQMTQAAAAAQQAGEQAQAPGRPTRDQIQAAVLEVAKKAAGGMSKVIDDQLTESRYKDASIKAIHSGHLYGTGILKGPLVERKIRTRFVEEVVKDAAGNPIAGKLKWVSKSESYVAPFVEATSIWRFFPDMTATKIEACRYTYEVHKMTKFKLAALAKNRSFDKTKIVEHIKRNPAGSSTDDYFDTELKSLGDREAKQGDNKNLYDVLERWGYVDGCDLKEIGVKVPADREHESFFMNLWLLPNGQVIKAVMQPVNGVLWPYHLYYFDKDETSIFGEGLGAIMRDDQKMLNAAIRMMLDNAALTSGPQLEVMMGMLANTDQVDQIFPWKVWLRNDDHPERAAVRPIEMPNSLDQLSKLAQIFENNADETTAIPRYMTGENVASGAASTASGMSMLMGAANIVIKDLITAWDEGITRPFLEALYRWNMQFHRDPAIKGDFDVKARGTASLVAKEVRAQALDRFAAETNNPLDAPFIKRDKMLRQRAEAHELSDVVKTEDEVKAEQGTKEFQEQQQMQKEMALAQVAEQKAKADKLIAEAELTKKKVDEMLANIDLTIAKTVETRVAAMFAAIQAGGAATNSPYVAPAADAVFRSAGGTDLDGTPGLKELNGPPVQTEQGTEQLLNKGQRFEQQPRGATTVETPLPAQGDPAQTDTGINPDPATGQVGLHAGIETTRSEPV